MTQKLTISIDKNIIDKPKYLAENYLDKITNETAKTEVPAEFKKIYGAVKLPEDFNSEKQRRINMEERFL